MAAAAILDFWNREILLVIVFHRDIKIFLIFHDGGRPPSWIRLRHIWSTHGECLGVYHSAKVGYDQCSSFYNMNISIFGTFDWKMPINAPKIGVFGQFDPINGLKYQPKPKRHTRAWIRVIWAIKRENVVSGLTCRCVALKKGCK